MLAYGSNHLCKPCLLMLNTTCHCYGHHVLPLTYWQPCSSHYAFKQLGLNTGDFFPEPAILISSVYIPGSVFHHSGLWKCRVPQRSSRFPTLSRIFNPWSSFAYWFKLICHSPRYFTFLLDQLLSPKDLSSGAGPYTDKILDWFILIF